MGQIHERHVLFVSVRGDPQTRIFSLFLRSARESARPLWLPRRADISGKGKLTGRSQPEEKVKAISGVVGVASAMTAAAQNGDITSVDLDVNRLLLAISGRF
jgi:hypothetical protein